MADEYSVFDNILTKGVRAGQIPARTADARQWYRNAAKGYKGRLDERPLVENNKDRHRTMPMAGSMYFFMYDPKHKDILPFYDRFPLVFPFRVASDRMWGINLHYLPLPLRAKLMDGLYSTVNNSRYDESTKLKISYKILESTSKFRMFKPCIKEYLFSHMKSKYMYVYPSEWDMALFLPVERFAKGTKQEVWRDSKTKIQSLRQKSSGGVAGSPVVKPV